MQDMVGICQWNNIFSLGTKILLLSNVSYMETANECE